METSANFHLPPETHAFKGDYRKEKKRKKGMPVFLTGMGCESVSLILIMVLMKLGKVWGLSHRRRTCWVW
jgi:hypothetical protein